MNKLFFSNLKPGTVLFGKFCVERCLSSGQLGAVYLCSRVVDSNQLVALKILSTPASKSADLSDTFKRELELSCRVIHPNVTAGADFFQDEDFTAFTMEYVSGGTLADAIERDKFTIDESLKVLFQLAAGLQALHNRGVVHRDLKPENALIDETGHVKISDFGIAVCDGSEDPGSRDRIVGTMNYLSPEYIARGEFDSRSDIYALGVIGYELITGRLPYEGGSLLESLMLRVKSDPISPHLLVPDCSFELSTIIMKAIKRFPEDRYQHVAELLRDLGRIMAYRSGPKTRKEVGSSVRLAQRPSLAA